MISLKKHLDSWSGTTLDPVLDAYLSFILAIWKNGGRAVPGLGKELERRLVDLGSSLEHVEQLAMVNEKVQYEFSQWADQAFERHEAAESEFRKITAAMADAVESITARDERYAQEVGDLTDRLRSITSMDDLAAVRRSIVESADSLAACVVRVAETGKESLRRLKADRKSVV